jgi:hypothetical protein
MDCNKSILVKQSCLYKELCFVNWGQSCQYELNMILHLSNCLFAIMDGLLAFFTIGWLLVLLACT